MRVRDLMSSPVQTCSPHDTLEHAARLLWEHDCGVLPVVDHNRRVGATITDRDICMGAYTKGGRLNELKVRDSMSKGLVSCRADDDLPTAARAMRQQRVRRLPVLDDAGRLVGLLSLNDLARAAAHDVAVGREALQTLTAICAHEQPIAQPKSPAQKAVAGAALS